MLETAFEKPEAGQERSGVAFRKQRIRREPALKCMLDVANEPFCENLAGFRAEMQAGEQDVLIGGTPEQFLAALRRKEGVPETLLDIKILRAKLKELVNEGGLKSTSAVFKHLRVTPVRYFVPDSEDL